MQTPIAFPSVERRAVSASRRIDWGRVVMVPLSVVLGALALLRIVALLGDGTAGGSAFDLVTAVATGVLVTAFYAVLVYAYLRRGPAHATTKVTAALVAAPVATFLPFVLPFTGSGRSPQALVVLGDLLLVVGFSFSVWSLRCLDRSLSVVPQVRTLVEHGPYATVRHPLYLGELVAMLGLALTLGGAAPLALWCALGALQACRALQEEDLLAARLPGYAAYQARTARIVPGLF
jgi:protein-S-isoprenylcysteine O-methyltransferase Ste14